MQLARCQILLVASFDIWTGPDWVAVSDREDQQHGLQLVGTLEARI